MAFQSVSVRTDRLLSGLYRYHGTVEVESQGAIRTETRKENTLGGDSYTACERLSSVDLQTGSSDANS